MSLEVRRMLEEDVDLVVDLYYEAFWDKAVALKNLDKDLALELIKVVLFKHPLNYQNYHIGLVDGQALGFIKLMTHESQEKMAMPSWSLIKSIGLFKLVKTGLLLSLIEERVKKGDLYIETLATHPKARGQGLGTHLLQFADQVVLGDGTLNRVSLAVIGRNSRAKALYYRQGFVVDKALESRILNRFLNINKVYHMKKDKV